jgi:hypothetical protein
LFDKKFNAGDGKLAIFIIDVNHRSSRLLRSIDIFFESRPHARSALIYAAPRLDFTCFLLLLVRFELNRLLANSKYLFVLHVFVLVDGVYNSFYKVLDFGFGTFTDVCLLVVD